MKKILCLLMSVFLLIGLCACTSNAPEKVNDNQNSNDASTSTTVKPETTTTTTSKEDAEKAEKEKIEECKEYLNSIKVYVCDYSVFDFDYNEQVEYVSFTPDAYPSEKACSVFLIVDYGDRTLKREYTPYLQVVVPNESNGIDDGVKHSCINTSWVLDSTIGMQLERFNREVPLKDISYKITVSELNLTVEGDLSDVVEYDKAMSVVDEHADGDSSIVNINNRLYMLIAAQKPEYDIYHIDGTNKYFVEKEYIYIPMSGGAEVSLTKEDFQYKAPDNLPSNISFGTRINHPNHTGYGNLGYDIVVGYCCIVELSKEQMDVVNGYYQGDYEKNREAFEDLFYEMCEYFDNVKVMTKNNGESIVLYEFKS